MYKYIYFHREIIQYYYIPSTPENINIFFSLNRYVQLPLYLLYLLSQEIFAYYYMYYRLITIYPNIHSIQTPTIHLYRYTSSLIILLPLYVTHYPQDPSVKHSIYNHYSYLSSDIYSL
jgi:hypothetical protein